MPTVDSLDIQISANANSATKAIGRLVSGLKHLQENLKFDTSSLEKLGKINGENFKKLGEGLNGFANAAKSIKNVDAKTFSRLADGIAKLGNIDVSKIENLNRINGENFRNLGGGIRALSSGMKDLQGVKTKDFTLLVKGIEKLTSLQTGNMESVGNALKPLADGINVLSKTNFDNKNLQNLINSLTRLSNANVGSLSGTNFEKIGKSISKMTQALSGSEKVQQSTIAITNAVANLAKAGANIPTVASSLPQLSTSLNSFINSMAGVSAVSAGTIFFTQALATLANAGTKAAATASGLGTLAIELKNFMQTMATAPDVSNNAIRLVNALARLAAQGGKAGAAANGLSSNLNNVSGSMSRLRGSTGRAITRLKSFSRQLLGSMGIYVGIYGAVKGLKNAIENSMNYIEVLNYFDKAFEQVAQKADYSNFQEMGYKSAEEYANSFSERAKELTAQMTGFEISPTGTLKTTGMPSLGLDPTQLMNYQAMFAQMSSSIGVTSETSLKLSRALTEIGADLASVKNMAFEKVWEDMASGLAGMSRTLDKYGANIRNVNLQQKLTELGINANITALNQNDKALLRAIILLDSTRYAWGDLAETIDNSNELLLVA